MALQSSGAISIDNIRTELGQARGNNSLRSLSSLAGKSTPDAMSEFYGYSAVTLTAKTVTSPGPEAWIMCENGRFFATQTVYSTLDPISSGATLYFDSAGSSLFNQGPGWIYEPDTGVTFYVDGNGVVQDEVQC